MNVILMVIGLFVIIMVISFLVGVDSGRRKEHQDNQKEAIRRGLAQYNPITGFFEWKDLHTKDLFKK